MVKQVIRGTARPGQSLRTSRRLAKSGSKSIRTTLYMATEIPSLWGFRWNRSHRHQTTVITEFENVAAFLRSTSVVHIIGVVGSCDIHPRASTSSGVLRAGRGWRKNCYVGGCTSRTLMQRTKGKAARWKKKRWVAQVKTNSTHPPKGLFTKRASTIARVLRSRKVSPKGSTSGLRMLTYFINRAGKGLSPSRRAELERAKVLLSKKRSPSRRQTPHRTRQASRRIRQV
jgi:uncharacterized protein DUF3175